MIHAKMVSEKILNLTHQAKVSARPLEEIRSKNSFKGDTSLLCGNLSVKLSKKLEAVLREKSLSPTAFLQGLIVAVFIETDYSCLHCL